MMLHGRAESGLEFVRLLPGISSDGRASFEDVRVSDASLVALRGSDSVSGFVGGHARGRHGRGGAVRFEAVEVRVAATTRYDLVLGAGRRRQWRAAWDLRAQSEGKEDEGALASLNVEISSFEAILVCLAFQEAQ